MLVRMLVRLMTCSVLALALSVATSGCMGMGKNPGAPQEIMASANFAADGIGGLAGFQSTVYAYATQNCIPCHATSQSPLFAVSDVNSAYAAATQYVDFSNNGANITASAFITQMNDGHCGSICNAPNGTQVMEPMLWQWYAATLNTGTTGSDATLIGNVFTNAIMVPTQGSVNSSTTFDGAGGDGCTNPEVDQECTYDGLNNTVLNPDGTPTACTNVCWTKFRYPIALMSPAPSASINRAWFEIDFSYGSYPDPVTGLGGSYAIANPRVVSLDGPVYIQDIRLFINGVYQPQYAAEFQDVDMVVNPWTPPTTVCGAANPAGSPPNNTPYNPTPYTPPAIANWALPANATPAQVTTLNSNLQTYMSDVEACNIPSVPNVYSTAVKPSGILQVNNPLTGPKDTISFSFNYLQPGIVNPCSAQMTWWNNIYSTIKGRTWINTPGNDGQQATGAPVIGGVQQGGQLLCLNCHRSGGDVTEAGQRFNMDDTDPLNCPAAPPLCSGATQSQCVGYSGTWTTMCSDTGFTTQASCLAQGGSWLGACSTASYTNETACETNGAVWTIYNTWVPATWGGTCTNISQSSCTAANPNATWVGTCPGTGCACTTAEAQTTVCGKFLQRTNLTSPLESSIIVQPADGLNGMPVQSAFTVYETKLCDNGTQPCGWLDWINKEATNAGK